MEASKKFKIKEEDALYNDWLYDKAVSLFKVKDRYFYLKKDEDFCFEAKKLHRMFCSYEHAERLKICY